jgi:hypothetical protein
MNMRDYPTLHIKTVNEHRDYPTLYLETVNEHERLSNITLRDCK